MAATFLEMLPPAGWGDVATHQQLLALETRVLARIESGEERLLAHIEAVEERLIGRMDRGDQHLVARIESGEAALRLELAQSLLRMQRSTMATILGSSAVVVAAVALLVR